MDRIKRLAENCHGLQVCNPVVCGTTINVEPLSSYLLAQQPEMHVKTTCQQSSKQTKCEQCPGFPRVPLVRRRHRIGLPLPADGATVHGVRQETEAGVRNLPRAAGERHSNLMYVFIIDSSCHLR